MDDDDYYDEGGGGATSDADEGGGVNMGELPSRGGSVKKKNARGKKIEKRHEKIYTGLGLAAGGPPAWSYNYSQAQAHIKATQFFESRLAVNPHMQRYNVCEASLKLAEGKYPEAQKYYATALAMNPGDVMVRSDFALGLAREGKLDQAMEEYRKALSTHPEQTSLLKNVSAVLARKGDYREASTYATRALQLNENDALAHRNVARIQAAQGDTRSALEHNMASIHLEAMTRPEKYDTAAMRAAAVQLVAQGGADKREMAHQLMTRARALEGKKMVRESSTRTYEIIANLNKRSGNKLERLKKEQEEEELRQQQKEAMKSGNPLLIAEAEKKAKEAKAKKEKEDFGMTL